ncbi:hypothetical protein IU438_16895 [Nocardia cyriacigeorgica]|uniref:hypothetical protein n=1 Tax=Nocardia cyriacigeorgica TaxID=135487 RepID=UPI001895301A|nr:hypothetical protein [Nocardia cyriacigeorgica]MBF6397466.1 hypothetical protein [Nocardia cyriacigeorgica]MBF6402876.1 hypothetical protein [Nocardia cyriacigeorgica]
MTDSPLRVLFCIGINQNFFDLPADGVSAADVWTAFVALSDGIKALEGIDFIGDMDDDATMVGPSGSWPWTCYLLADADSYDTVSKACGLVRTIQVGTSDWKVWKFLRIEARIGRALTPRQY